MIAADGNDVRVLPVGLPDGVVGGDQAPVSLAVKIPHVVDPYEVARTGIGFHPERAVIDQVHVPLGRSGVFVLGEGVGVLGLDGPERFLFTEDLHGLLVDIIERPHVVQSARMVLVLVRQEDGIQVADPLCEHLHPEIRSCVDEKGHSFVFHEGRRPEPLVPRVRRPAYRTLARDNRHALRCPRPQESQFRFAHNTMSSNWFTDAGSYGFSTRM